MTTLIGPIPLIVSLICCSIETGNVVNKEKVVWFRFRWPRGSRKIWEIREKWKLIVKWIHFLIESVNTNQLGCNACKSFDFDVFLCEKFSSKKTDVFQPGQLSVSVNIGYPIVLRLLLSFYCSVDSKL